MKSILIIFFLVLSLGIKAQYWFGPKVGGHRTDFIYQNAEYKSDSFDINYDLGAKYGFTIIYQATEKYAVQGDLSFIRVNKELKNSSNNDILTISNLNMNYLSLPMSFRFNFGGVPVHYYLSGGPVLNFWLNGSGEIYLDEFNEARTIDGPIPYKIVFNQSKGGESNQRAIVSANRVQYGLQFGFGSYFDLMSAGRFLIDFNYIFGHSNMAFNNNPDFNQFESYSENFEFRNNTLSVSLAYLFLYDPVLNKRGRSNNSLTRDQQKKEDKKRFTNRKSYKK